MAFTEAQMARAAEAIERRREGGERGTSRVRDWQLWNCCTPNSVDSMTIHTVCNYAMVGGRERERGTTKVRNDISRACASQCVS
jgi:hypothetical protein